MKQDNFPEALIIHCSAVKDGPVLDARGIIAFHVSKGWDTVGYHFLLDFVLGETLVIQGRPFWMHGAHCPPMNKKSLGVCVIGEFDTVAPTDRKLQKTAELCAALCHLHTIPVRDIRPHRDYARDGRSCPGKLFDMKRLKDLTREILTKTIA